MWNERVKPSFVNPRTAQTLKPTTYIRTYTSHAHTHTQLDTQNIHKGYIKVRGSSQSTKDATPLPHLTYTVHMSVIVSVSVSMCLCLIVYTQSEKETDVSACVRVCVYGRAHARARECVYLCARICVRVALFRSLLVALFHSIFRAFCLFL